MNHRLLFVSLLACGLVAQVRGAESTPATPTAATPITATAATTHKPGDIVARVNGSEIKFKDLDAICKAVRSDMARSKHGGLPQQEEQLERNILERMIMQEVILQEGKKQLPSDLDTKVQQQLEEFKKQAGGEEEFAAKLSEQGLSKEEVVRQIRDSIVIEQTVEKYVEAQVKITPEEVKDFYEKNLSKFPPVPETVRASHILVSVPADASEDIKKAQKAKIEAARTLVKGGEPFADVAKKVSDCRSKARGGDLGFFSREQMVPAFSDVAFSLPTNQLSEVVTTQVGYHIILVTAKKEAHKQTLEDVREKLQDYLRMAKSSQAAQQYVKNLREKAKVEILLEPVAVPAPVTKPATTVETPPVAAPKK